LLYKSGKIRLRPDFPKANPVQPYLPPDTSELTLH